MPKNQNPQMLKGGLVKLADGHIFDPNKTLQRQAEMQKRATEALEAARKARR